MTPSTMARLIDIVILPLVNLLGCFHCLWHHHCADWREPISCAWCDDKGRFLL